MDTSHNRSIQLFLLVSVALLLSACTAGDAQFTPETPAGFWYGLWHGIISVIALIVHVFNEHVGVYEINNTGGWYDCGFLLGVILIWGGGSHVNCKSAKKKQRDKEWEEVGEKVEMKVMRKLQAWADEEESGDVSAKEWDEIGAKVEKKLKRKIREWAEKD
jgi:hypothetical protein